MKKFITNSTATSPLGAPTGQKCMMVPSGKYIARMAIVYASAPATISLVTANSPYTDFSTPTDIVTDSADSPFDAFMDSDGSIYLAYIKTSSNDLIFVKLSFSGGVWTTGTPVTVYSSDDCSYPSVIRLTMGQVWIAYTRLNGGDYYISAKKSTDDGVSWGSASDPGDTLTGGDTSAYSKMVEMGGYQYLFYSEGGSQIAYCSKADGSGTWGSEVVLASESGYDENFSAGVSSDGRIGIAYSLTGGLKFREFTGSSWAGEQIIDSESTAWPVVSYQGGSAYVIFYRTLTANMGQPMYASQNIDSFNASLPLDPRKSDLSKLLVYSDAAGTYQDKTTEASSADSADIFHSSSNVLLSAEGDAVYFGMDEPFNYLHMILSTIGSGGVMVWKYWDGQGWTSFTPESGAWNFTTAEEDLLLWQDFQSIPGNWQKKELSGNTCYWIAGVVSSSFSGSPIGSRINGITNLKALSAQV